MHFDGLYASIKSKHNKIRTVRSLLVSHTFVELWRVIEDDKSFDKTMFNQLSESERDFMAYAVKRTKVPAREFERVYNQSLSHYIDRLNMIQSAIRIGDDNPSLKTEMKSILDKLYQKGVFSHQFYNHFKKYLHDS
jgi:IS1 family transposase